MLRINKKAKKVYLAVLSSTYSVNIIGIFSTRAKAITTILNRMVIDRDRGMTGVEGGIVEELSLNKLVKRDFIKNILIIKKVFHLYGYNSNLGAQRVLTQWEKGYIKKNHNMKLNGKGKIFFLALLSGINFLTPFGIFSTKTKAISGILERFEVDKHNCIDEGDIKA